MSPSDEDLVKQAFQKHTAAEEIEPPPVDEVLKKTLNTASQQTVSKDMIALAVTSLFAVLLVFFAPFAKRGINKNSAPNVLKLPAQTYPNSSMQKYNE